MQEMGHEISYHYDVMDSCKGDLEAAIAEFEKNRKRFEEKGLIERIVEPERIITFRVPWIDDNGKVAGVIVETPNGNYKINSKAVIIATGGFGANPEIIVSYKPSLKGFGTTNHAGATGDALTWITDFNGDVVDMEQIQTHPTVVPEKNIMITEAVRGNGAIMINRDGKRFGSEMATRDVMSDAILKQKGKFFYIGSIPTS